MNGDRDVGERRKIEVERVGHDLRARRYRHGRVATKRDGPARRFLQGAAAGRSRDVDGGERQRRLSKRVRKAHTDLLAANRDPHVLPQRRVAKARCGRQIGVFNKLGCGGPRSNPFGLGGLRGERRREGCLHPNDESQ